MSLTSKPRVNWHEAASCAFQIELKDYSHILEYISEYPLGKNSYRIDLLVIKKLTDEMIVKNIAQIFRTFNLLEIKGVGSSVNIDSYYKTIGYAGLLIAQMGKSKNALYKTQHSRLDVSLTFLSCHYPRKLMKHLIQERNLPVAKISNGVYYINKETFLIQIIVTKELSYEDNLYLHCLTDNLQDAALISRLADDYKLHQEQEIYIKYLHQISTANTKAKGDNTMMVCEGLLNLFGTSSAEIIERTKKEEAEYYLPQINQLTSQNAYLKSLLVKHNIAFDLESASSPTGSS
ncbi:MAG: hypothetical protein NC321_13470 [Clostridium sp.]|nr:hypothetical protein [Clostridium sp.]